MYALESFDYDTGNWVRHALFPYQEDAEKRGQSLIRRQVAGKLRIREAKVHREKLVIFGPALWSN